MQKKSSAYKLLHSLELDCIVNKQGPQKNMLNAGVEPAIVCSFVVFFYKHIILQRNYYSYKTNALPLGQISSAINADYRGRTCDRLLIRVLVIEYRFECI